MGNFINPRVCARPDSFDASVGCGRLDGVFFGVLIAIAVAAFAWQAWSRQKPEERPPASTAVPAVAAAAIAIPLATWWVFGFLAGRRRLLDYEEQMDGYRERMMQNGDLVSQQTSATVAAGANIAAAIASR